MTEEQNNKEPFEENFFEQMENAPATLPLKQLQRSRSNVVLTGTCAGIAEYFHTEAANVRLIAIISLLLGGWSAVAYLITAVLLPVEQKADEVSNADKSAIRKENFRVVVSGILIFVGFYFALQQIGFSSGNGLFIFPNSFVFPILAVATGVYLMTNKRNFDAVGEEPPLSFHRTREDRILLGVCGGIGKYLEVDSTVVRIIFIFATLLTLGLFAAGYIMISLISSFEVENKIETQQ